MQTHWNSVKILIISSDSHCAKHMMFIFKITGVKFWMLLCKYHNMTLAVNDAVAYTHHVHNPIERFLLQLLNSTFDKLILK